MICCGLLSILPVVCHFQLHHKYFSAFFLIGINIFCVCFKCGRKRRGVWYGTEPQCNIQDVLFELRKINCLACIIDEGSSQGKVMACHWEISSQPQNATLVEATYLVAYPNSLDRVSTIFRSTTFKYDPLLMNFPLKNIIHSIRSLNKLLVNKILRLLLLLLFRSH